MSLAERLPWDRYPILVDWRCCGHLWELLLTPKHPERFDWGPRCPTCGKQHEDGWTRLEAKLREEQIQSGNGQQLRAARAEGHKPTRRGEANPSASDITRGREDD